MYAVFFAIAVLIAIWVIERRRLPAGISLSSTFRDIDPYHYDKALEFARRFETERRNGASGPSIYALEGFKSLFELNVNELLFRVPNDVNLEDSLRVEIRQAMTVLDDHIQRIRKREQKTVPEYPMPLSQNYF